MSRIFALSEEDVGLSEEELKEKYTGKFKIKNEVGKNLFETYEVNSRTYTDNLPKNAFISIPKKQYIEYEQQKEEIERLNNIINELEKTLDENVELTYVHNGKRQYNKTLTEGGLLFRDYIKSKLQELKGDESNDN